MLEADDESSHRAAVEAELERWKQEDPALATLYRQALDSDARHGEATEAANATEAAVATAQAQAQATRTKLEAAALEARERRRAQLAKTAALRRVGSAVLLGNHLQRAADAVRYGFLGFDGEASRMLVTSLCSLPCAPVGLVSVTRELGDKAIVGLEERFGRVLSVLAAHQDVVNAADVLVLDVPLSEAAAALGALRFLPRHVVVSLVPAAPLAVLHECCHPALPENIVRAITLPPLPLARPTRSTRGTGPIGKAAAAPPAAALSDGGLGATFKAALKATPPVARGAAPPAASEAASSDGGGAAAAAAGSREGRAALMVTAVRNSIAVPLPDGAANLFVASSAVAVAMGPFDECFWASAADEASWREAVTTGRDGWLCLSGLDTEEAKPLACRGLSCDAERRVDMMTPHLELCALLLHSLPAHSVPQVEQLRAAHSVLLPVLRRGLPPVLRDIERLGKMSAPFYWSAKAAFESAAAAFVDDFVLPELLRTLPAAAAASERTADAPDAPDADADTAATDAADAADTADADSAEHDGFAPPAVRLAQLEVVEAVHAYREEASAAHRRQLSMAEAAWRAAREPQPWRASVGDSAGNSTANAAMSLGAMATADVRRAQAAVAERWDAATEAARAAAKHAEAARVGFSFPRVGSRVRLECRRPFQPPQLLDGVVVRHTRGAQQACSVRLADGAHRLVAASSGDCRIVEVMSSR